ncbi:MAG: DNA-binding protein [Bdellovibrionales bacterium]
MDKKKQRLSLKKLKSKKDIEPFHASKKLKDKKHVKAVLFDCLSNGDTEIFKEVLRTHLELVNKDKFIKKIKMSKTTFYRTLSKNSNPTLKNVSKIMKAI